MTRSAIQFLTLIICATTLAAAPAESGTRHHKHIRTVRPAWPGVSPPAQSGEVCPGIARSFECKIWPPPIDQDPDRKASGSDGA